MSTKKSNTDWVALKNEYITTNISLRKMAEKYHISFNTVKKHAQSDNWGQEKKETYHKITTEVQQKVVEEVINEKVEINKRHSELYQKGLDLVDDFLTQYAIEIEKWKSGKVEKPKASPYALECLMNCIQKGQNGQRLAYNIDGNDTAETDPEIFTIEGIDTEKI